MTLVYNTEDPRVTGLTRLVEEDAPLRTSGCMPAVSLGRRRRFTRMAAEHGMHDLCAGRSGSTLVIDSEEP